ncbi:sensor histidine kinase [Streptomyces olivoreticuli]|uniref:sensor histidine kinase n=1 Tax=Streptomyces olivoreticuli TaxID=68246 RepID=UPI000E23B541|nr:HAMP domain-containing sensor histidine kinase [Streptomyces olivoreticuli]
MPGSVPPHKTLLARLLTTSVIVAVCSIAATTWLAVQTTSGAFNQERGQALAEDTRIYNTLLGIAARAPGWKNAGPTVSDLARQTGRRITLTTQDGKPIASSSTRALPPSAKAAAVLDPLSVDTALSPKAAASRIDPRAAGPYTLTAAEHADLRKLAERSAACLHRNAVTADVKETPSGRPYVQAANDSQNLSATQCAIPELGKPTPTERRALDQLDTLVNACLKRHQMGPVNLSLDYTWTTPAPHTGSSDPTTASCVDSGRREQLTPYVSTPALLYLSSADGAPSAGFRLSPADTARVAGAAALVLTVTLAVTVFAATRLVRPLRALTSAAERMKAGDTTARVNVPANSEISQLASAFNDMSETRARLEDLRKAMVSDIAHELRTPLSNIRGWLEAAQDHIVPTDPALLSSLLEEAVLLQHIIDDLQDLAAADAGTLRLRPEPVYLADLLSQVAAAHLANARRARVTLSVCRDADPFLNVDPVRLRQAVGNLVSNAVRHTPPGGSVTLRAAQEEDVTVIEVTDTGTGIDADDLPHVFDRFWRAEKSRNRETGGSGLGLTIVRKLTEAHGGTATVSSTLSGGTTFSLRFPTDDVTPGSFEP